MSWEKPVGPSLSPGEMGHGKGTSRGEGLLVSQLLDPALGSRRFPKQRGPFPSVPHPAGMPGAPLCPWHTPLDDTRALQHGSAELAAPGTAEKLHSWVSCTAG